MAEEDPQYLAWIRLRPCAACEVQAPNHPHHHTHGNDVECQGCGTVHTASAKLPGFGGRGKGTRAHDHDAMPMCWRCHRQFHDAAGRFEGWSKARRRGWQNEQVASCQSLFFDEGAF